MPASLLHSSFLIPSSTKGPRSCSLLYKVNEERKTEKCENPSWGHTTSKWPNKVKSESESHSVVSGSLRPYGLYSLWNSPGQNTRVSSHSLLQGIFPSQRSNPGLPHFRWILYLLSHRGSPRRRSYRYNPAPAAKPQFAVVSLESKWGWRWRGASKACPSQLSLQVPKGPPKNP